MEFSRNPPNKPVFPEPASYKGIHKAFKSYYGKLSTLKMHNAVITLNKTEEASTIIVKPSAEKVNTNESYSSPRKVEGISGRKHTASTIATPTKDTSMPPKRRFRSINSSFAAEEKVSQSAEVKSRGTRHLSLIYEKSPYRKEEKKEKKEEVKQNKSPGRESIRPFSSRQPKPLVEEKKSYAVPAVATRGRTIKELKEVDTTISNIDKVKIAAYFRYRLATLSKLIEERSGNKSSGMKTERSGMQRPAYGAYSSVGSTGRLQSAKESCSTEEGNRGVDEVWSVLKAKASARSKFKYKGITNYSKTIRDLIKSILPADSAQQPKKPMDIKLSDKDPNKKKKKKPKSPKEDQLIAFSESVHHSANKVFIVIGGYPRIKKALRERGWIENPDKTSKNFDLKWGSRTDMDFMSLQPNQLVNHCSKSISITSKVELAWNMRNLIWQGEDIDNYYPRCYDLSDLNELDDFLEDFKFEQAIAILRLMNKNSRKVKTPQDESLFKVKLCVALSYCEKRLKDLESVVNGIVKGDKQTMGVEEWEILNANNIKSILEDAKYDTLVNNVTRRYQITLDKEEGSKEADDAVYINKRVEEVLVQFEQVFPQGKMNQGKNAWIVKPAGLSRGRGISCHSELGNLLEHIKIRGSDWIAQKYIENPLIIKNRKFDIRQWVLVTDWSPLTVWFYEESYVRFTAQDFNPDNLGNKFAHLTNNAIACKASNFHNSAIEGNMWDSNQFKDYLQETTGNNVFEERIKPQMKNIVIKSLQCSKDTPELRKNTFELYGYDFMVDQDFKVWLIEVNSSPCMEYSTKITERLVKMVLEDCIKVVVDYGMADPANRKQINTGCFKKIFQDRKCEKPTPKFTHSSKFY